MPEEMKPYTPKTEEEHERLAQDIVAGKVWGPWSIEQQDGTYLDSFLVWRLMLPELSQWAKEHKITCVYEYLSEAGPRSINGRPVFFSAQTLNADDFMAVMIRVVAITEHLAARKAESLKEG